MFWIAIRDFMKRYLSSFLVAVAAWAAGCTEVDDTLGQRMVPQNQQMELAFGEVSPFRSYIALNDSVPASGQGVLFLGNREDATFGRMRASAMVDFYPVITELDEGDFFTENPVIDSMYLEMQIRRIVGNGGVEQKFNIYAMRDSMKRDSVYRQGVRVSEKADLDRPLFSFSLSDGIPAGSVARFKLDIEPAGEEYLYSLADVPQQVYENPWPEFNKEFYGFYIALDPATEVADAAVYEIVVDESYGGFYVFFHEEGTEVPEGELTPFATFDFRTTGWYTDNRKVNVYVNQIEYTYPAEIDGSIEDFDSPLATVYAQSPGGLVSSLRATDELLVWLDEAREGYSGMVIHKAQLEVPLAAEADQPAELLPLRLGMYYQYGTARPLPDYNFSLENNSVSPVTLPYGGYLYRTGGYYRMDIAQWLTKLMLDPENTPKEIWLGVDVNTRAEIYSQVALDAEGIRLKITYTLIR